MIKRLVCANIMKVKLYAAKEDISCNSLDACLGREYAGGEKIVAISSDIEFSDELTLDLGGMTAVMYHEVSPHSEDIVRSVSALNQVIFALNEEYCLNEKKAVKMIEGFAVKPEDYKNRVDAVFASAGVDNRSACALLRNLADDVGTLSASSNE